MIDEREKGFALPIVIAILTILVFIGFFLISQLVRHRQTTQLYLEIMQAQYAAESGIAMMQERIAQQPEDTTPLLYRYEHYFVVTHLVSREPLVELEATSNGKRGVKQTIRVLLDPETLEIKQWIK